MKIFYLAFLASSLLLAPLSLNAMPQEHRHGEAADFSRILSRVKSSLELSGEQEEEISALFREYSERKKLILSEFAGKGDEDALARDISMRKLNREMETRLEGILDPGQIGEYRRLREETRSERRSGERDGRLRERMERMAERLKLSAEQIAAVEPIMAEHSDNMRKLFESRRDSGRDGMRGAREKIEELDSRLEKRLESVLTGDQMNEYRKIREEERERMRDRMERGVGPGHGPPR